jgi:predicted RNase H-like nuclease
MRFVGVDLAWSPRNRSAGVVLSADGQLLEAIATLGTDDDILAFIVRAIPADRPGLIAIDAPLAVPNETGSRSSDKHVAAVFGRFQAGPYPANRKNLARYGGLRGEEIRRRLQSHAFRFDPHIARQTLTRQVVEVFPHPATVSLFHLERTLKYKARSGREYPFRWRELERLRQYLAVLAEAKPSLRLSPEVAEMPIEGLRGRAFKRAEDLLDAIVCAFSALYAWYHGPQGYEVYSPQAVAGQDHILVPMTPWMRERVT